MPKYIYPGYIECQPCRMSITDTYAGEVRQKDSYLELRVNQPLSYIRQYHNRLNQKLQDRNRQAPAGQYASQIIVNPKNHTEFKSAKLSYGKRIIFFENIDYGTAISSANNSFKCMQENTYIAEWRTNKGPGDVLDIARAMHALFTSDNPKNGGYTGKFWIIGNDDKATLQAQYTHKKKNVTLDIKSYHAEDRQGTNNLWCTFKQTKKLTKVVQEDVSPEEWRAKTNKLAREKKYTGRVKTSTNAYGFPLIDGVLQKEFEHAGIKYTYIIDYYTATKQRAEEQPKQPETQFRTYLQDNDEYTPSVRQRKLDKLPAYTDPKRKGNNLLDKYTQQTIDWYKLKREEDKVNEEQARIRAQKLAIMSRIK